MLTACNSSHISKRGVHIIQTAIIVIFVTFKAIIILPLKGVSHALVVIIICPKCTHNNTVIALLIAYRFQETGIP